MPEPAGGRRDATGARSGPPCQDSFVLQNTSCGWSVQRAPPRMKPNGFCFSMGGSWIRYRPAFLQLALTLGGYPPSSHTMALARYHDALDNSNGCHKDKESPMLVLSRNPQQSVLIGDDIRVTVTCVDGGQVKIGIEAPQDIVILREEIAPHYPKQITRQQRQS